MQLKSRRTPCESISILNSGFLVREPKGSIGLASSFASPSPESSGKGFLLQKTGILRTPPHSGSPGSLAPWRRGAWVLVPNLKVQSLLESGGVRAPAE